MRHLSSRLFAKAIRTVVLGGLVSLISSGSPASAQDGSPRQFQSDVQAKPIWSPNRSDASVVRLEAADNGGGTAMVRTSAVLRWRSRKPAASRNTATAARHETNVWRDRETKIGGDVRLVNHEQAPNLFNDPFGDRVAQTDNIYQPGDNSRGGAFQPLPNPAEPSLSPAPKPADSLLPGQPPELQPSPPPKGYSDPLTQPKEPGSDPATTPNAPDLTPGVPPAFSLEPPAKEPSAADPSTKQEVPPAGTPSDPPPSPDGVLPTPKDDQYYIPDYLRNLPQRESEKQPCDKVYNGRNCCSEAQKCKTAREKLYNDPITRISLDITAPFKPDAMDDAEEDQARQDKLSLVPARTWRDRKGRVITSGKVVDISYRRANLKSTATGELIDVPIGELSDDDLCFLAAWWGVPSECMLGDEQFVARSFTPLTFTWKASATCSKPLYFEQVQLERYGHTTGPICQPFLSGVHFFGSIIVLPYKMGINPPRECVYPVGYYRPGSCAPWLLPPIPLSVRGGLAQAGAVVGGVYLIP